MNLPRSSHFAVVEQLSSSMIRVARSTKTGKPVSGGVVFEACAICFTNTHGKQAPPIVGGVCAWCGHREVGTELDAETREQTPQRPGVQA